MRVEFCKNIQVEGEVVVTVEDIQAALREHLEEVGKRKEPRAVQRALKYFINAAYQTLSAVPGDSIERLDPSHRELIAKSLREEASRYYSA